MLPPVHGVDEYVSHLLVRLSPLDSTGGRRGVGSVDGGEVE